MASFADGSGACPRRTSAYNSAHVFKPKRTCFCRSFHYAADSLLKDFSYHAVVVVIVVFIVFVVVVTVVKVVVSGTVVFIVVAVVVVK